MMGFVLRFRNHEGLTTELAGEGGLVRWSRAFEPSADETLNPKP